MPTREDIREGIADIFDTPFTDGENNTIKTVHDFSLLLSGKVTSYLLSQGVVLKVERELPANPWVVTEETKVQAKRGELGSVLCVGNHNRAWEAQQDMLKAGYVATVPLIEKE